MSAPARTAATNPSVAAAAGLIGGFLAGHFSGRRVVAAVPFAAAGVWAARQWDAQAGEPVAAALVGGYVGAMGVSHPLAKRIGAWPSVLAVTAVLVSTSELLRRRSA